MNDAAGEVRATGTRFSEETVEVEGRAIRYRAAGEGDVVVSLHGAGGLRVSGTHELLADQYRVVVFELPGFGTSPEFTGSMQELAGLMNQAVAKLGIKRFNLMGNSFGTKVALWMAIQNKDPIASLVLLSPAAIRIDGTPLTPEEHAASMFAHPERQPKASPPPPEVQKKQAALVGRLRGPGRDAELEAHLGELDVPVMAVFGTEDRITPSDAAHLYRELLPNCSLMMIYDAAHALDADRPEAVASVVADFLERHESFLVTGESGLIHP